jgi:hypothetical protein
MTTKIEEMKAATESLENPATGLHQLPGQAGLPRPNAQLVDRGRLLQAWESNVKTQRGVIAQLELNQKSMRITRWMTVLAVFAIVFLGWLIREQATGVLVNVKAIQDQTSQLTMRTDERLQAQEKKLDLVLTAVTQLLEAGAVAEAAKASPKDQDLKREATRTRVQALGSALAAKKEVTPAPQVAREVDQKLRELKQEAAAKGLDVQLPATF